MNLVCCQLDIVWENKPANHAKVRALLDGAALGQGSLVILPEMFATGFSMSPERTVEEPGGMTEEWLKAMARALDLHVLAGVAQHSEAASAPLPENRALLVSPDGAVVRYAKLHPFSFSGEDQHYGAGARVVTREVEGVRVTPFVCYDLRFPEPFRLAADETDLYAVIANWPERRRAHWSTLLEAGAIENLAYVAGVNRVGEGDGLRYAGDSALLTPWGEALVSGSEEETVLIGEVDPAKVAEARAKFPVLADRRPQAYRR